MADALDRLVARWGALGAGFDAPLGAGTPDLERLLLDTARHAPRMARLFIMAATWLHEHGEMVAQHRLRRLIRDELEPEHHATLGLLLDLAQKNTRKPEFASTLKRLTPATEPSPLFAVEARTPARRALALKRASDRSKRWGRWCAPIELKPDALRPASWILRRHPALRTRCDFRGDLRASVLAALRFDPRAGESQLRLSKLAGGTRQQVLSVLDHLEKTGRVIVGPPVADHGPPRCAVRLA